QKQPCKRDFKTKIKPLGGQYKTFRNIEHKFGASLAFSLEQNNKIKEFGSAINYLFSAPRWPSNPSGIPHPIGASWSTPWKHCLPRPLGCFFRIRALPA